MLPLHLAVAGAAPVEVISLLLEANREGASTEDNNGDLPLHRLLRNIDIVDSSLAAAALDVLLAAYPEGEVESHSYRSFSAPKAFVVDVDAYNRILSQSNSCVCVRMCVCASLSSLCNLLCTMMTIRCLGEGQARKPRPAPEHNQAEFVWWRKGIAVVGR